MKLGSCTRARGIPCRPNPAATQHVLVALKNSVIVTKCTLTLQRRWICWKINARLSISCLNRLGSKRFEQPSYLRVLKFCVNFVLKISLMMLYKLYLKMFDVKVRIKLHSIFSNYHWYNQKLKFTNLQNCRFHGTSTQYHRSITVSELWIWRAFINIQNEVSF